MKNTIQLNKCIIGLINEQSLYYMGDLKHLDSAEWLKKVNRLNNQIASELKCLYLTQILTNNNEALT